MALGCFSGAELVLWNADHSRANFFLWMSDTGLIALCTFSAICWGEVGKASSCIGTLGGV